MVATRIIAEILLVGLWVELQGSKVNYVFHLCVNGRFPKFSHIYFEQQLKIKQYKLIQDCVTRCGNTLLMIERILE